MSESTLDDIRRRRNEGCSAPADVEYLLSLVDRLREALKPFAGFAERVDADESARLFGDCTPIDLCPGRLRCHDDATLGDCRAARKALEESR